MDERPPTPRLIAITPAGWLLRSDATAQGEALLAAGLPALMLREPGPAPDGELLGVARRLAEAARRHGALLVVNRRLALADAVEAGGVQLGAAGPSIAMARARLGERVWIGWSAHSVVEAAEARRDGADAVLLSPVFPTASKPGARALGVEAIAAAVAADAGPVLALGGVTAERVAVLRSAGAHGVAVMGAVFDSGGPAAVGRLLAALAAAGG